MKTPRLSFVAMGVAFLGFAAAAHAQVDLGSPTSRTPYDIYLEPMWAVLRGLDGRADAATVADLVRRGKAFRYSYKKDEPYVPQAPDETERLKAGDCKAKSLWLASKLNDRSVRFVIGKAKQVRGVSHAWLMWQGPEGWLILDATLFSSPLVPSRISPTAFVPTYSYSPSGKYSHRTAAAAASQAKNGDHL